MYMYMYMYMYVCMYVCMCMRSYLKERNTISDTMNISFVIYYYACWELLSMGYFCMDKYI